MCADFRLERKPQPKSLSGPRGATRPTTALRWGMRVALVAAIFATAWYQGYSGRALGILAMMVLWAAALPILARFAANYLKRSGIEGPTRTVLVIMACLVLLAAFAVTARLLLPVS